MAPSSWSATLPIAGSGKRCNVKMTPASLFWRSFGTRPGVATTNRIRRFSALIQSGVQHIVSNLIAGSSTQDEMTKRRVQGRPNDERAKHLAVTEGQLLQVISCTSFENARLPAAGQTNRIL